MSGKGAVFELRVKRELEAAGWLVTKSGGSTGHADLVAVRKEGDRTRVLYVEAKSGSQLLRPEQWNQLCQAAELCGAVPVLADKVPGVAAPRFWRLTGLKTAGRSGSRQPRVPFDIDQWREDAA